jgi:hypothetical protein
VELKPVEATLDDLEQRSYWLDVKQRRRVTLEAAGRSLADLRLWTNGDWLVDAEPSREVVSPKPAGRSLVCRLVADLDPGLYLVTAYGGASRPQAEESGEHAFHLRFGVPVLGRGRTRAARREPVRHRLRLVPGTATYFPLELPDAGPAALAPDRRRTRRAVGAPLPDRARKPSARDHEELRSCRSRRLDVDRRDAAKRRLVAVTGAPGQPYVLQHFDRGTRRSRGAAATGSCRRDGHVLDLDGALRRSGGLGRRDRDRERGQPARAAAPHVKPVLAQVVELAEGRGSGAAISSTRCTCSSACPTRARTSSSRGGRKAAFRIEPFLVKPPVRATSRRPSAPAGEGWDLEPGYYVLTAEPVKKGILDVALRAAGTSGDAFAASAAGVELPCAPRRSSRRSASRRAATTRST